MVITFSWPRPHDNEWSDEVAISLIGSTVKVDGRDGKITEAHINSNGALQVTIKFRENDDES